MDGAGRAAAAVHLRLLVEHHADPHHSLIKKTPLLPQCGRTNLLSTRKDDPTHTKLLLYDVANQMLSYQWRCSSWIYLIIKIRTIFAQNNRHNLTALL